MSCEAFGILISKWVDGEASADEVRRAESHIASCAACRRLADEFRRNSALVESAFGPESFGQQVAGGVLRQIARRESVLRWGARLGIAAAALAAFALWRSDRAAEREALERRLDAALRVLQEFESRRPAVADEPRVVVREIVREPYFVPVGGGESVAHRPTGPAPDRPGTDGTESPADPGGDLRPGTVAMDRVDALPDHETGAIALNWRMDRAPGAVYFVYRRESGAADFDRPLNAAPLAEPRFEDRSALALTTYEYRVVAMLEGQPVVADTVARVTTPPDLQVTFLGRGTLNGKVAALFSVHLRRDGRWLEQTFTVEPGGEIGGALREADFSTGLRLERIEEAARWYTFTSRDRAGAEVQRWSKVEPRAAVATPGGALLLWKDATAVGSRQRLEVVEAAR